MLLNTVVKRSLMESCAQAENVPMVTRPHSSWLAHTQAEGQAGERRECWKTHMRESIFRLFIKVAVIMPSCTQKVFTF